MNMNREYVIVYLLNKQQQNKSVFFEIGFNFQLTYNITKFSFG